MGLMDCIHESVCIGKRCQCSLFMACLIWGKRWQANRSDDPVQRTSKGNRVREERTQQFKKKGIELLVKYRKQEWIFRFKKQMQDKEWRLISSRGNSPPEIKDRNVEPTLRLFPLSSYTHTSSSRSDLEQSLLLGCLVRIGAHLFSVYQGSLWRRWYLSGDWHYAGRQPVGCVTHLSLYLLQH